MRKIRNILLLLSVALSFCACNSDFDKAGEVGYLKLDLTTLVSTNTRTAAPEDYAPKKLHVVLKRGTTIVLESDYENGVFSNSNMRGYITLEAGTYTITAQSANWDGSGSGFGVPFYYGETTVEVKSRTLQEASLTCTQANVKVTVNFDKSFKDNFTEAQASVISAGDPATSESPILFTMGEDRGSAYFPVGNLKVHVSVKNKGGVWHGQDNEITDVQARQHCIINYKVAESGTQGKVEVVIDDASNSYIYNVELPQESGILLEANPVTDSEADAVSGNYAVLSGTGMGDEMDEEKIVLRYRQRGTSEWTVVESNELNPVETEAGEERKVTFSYKLTGIVAGVNYEYQFYHDDPENSAESNSVFFTVNGYTLYNGGFELWHEESVQGLIGNTQAAYATESSSVKYWDSSNKGAARGGNGRRTNKEEEKVHSGSCSAKLASSEALNFLAAASLYTGEFSSLNLTSQVAELKWGVPFGDDFKRNNRPKGLKGYMIYEPGKVNIAAKNNYASILPSEAPAEGEDDHCQIYCALLTEQITISNAIVNGRINIPAWGKEDHDPRVIAYGAYTVTEKQNDWTPFDITLEYYDTETRPTHLLIVCSACKYGDYFHGSSSSVLYLDDFELVY